MQVNAIKSRLDEQRTNKMETLGDNASPCDS